LCSNIGPSWRASHRAARQLQLPAGKNYEVEDHYEKKAPPDGFLEGRSTKNTSIFFVQGVRFLGDKQGRRIDMYHPTLLMEDISAMVHKLQALFSDVVDGIKAF
jgi:hypothetical protein